MRIGIVSDIHCNAEALQRCIDRLGTIDELWCAGDIMSQSSFSNDTMRLLREHGARCVLGNHDDLLLSWQGERARAAAHVDAELLQYLAEQPAFHETTVDGRRVLMTHATPFAPHSAYVWPHSPELRRMGELETDFLILGHTHQPMAVEVGSVLVVNPGSTGQKTKKGAVAEVTCGLLDTATGGFELIAVPVD